MLACVTSREYELLTRTLGNKQAVCIGDTTIASTCVHSINTNFDGVVYVNIEADAGQFFYKRLNRGEIVHIDVFHENGYVSHKQLAENLIKEIKLYKQLYAADHKKGLSQTRIEDFIDVQTATGGGRVSGSGRHGRSKNVRKNHLNHCHLTMLLKPSEYRLMLYLVDTVEKTILNQGLKLAKLKNICYEKTKNIKKINEDFESSSDTMLNKSLKPSPNTPNYYDNNSLLASLQGNSVISAEWSMISTNTFDLGFHCDSIEDITERFKLNYKTQIEPENPDNIDQMIGTKQIFNTSSKSIKHYSDYTVINNSQLYAKSYRSKNNLVSEHGGSLAVARSVKNALVRNLQDEDKQSLTFNQSDLRYYQKPRQSYRNFLFLFDCSASMKGARIKAASILVDRLLSWSRDKVAVISIQENNTKLQCSFTRNRHQLLNTIKGFKPLGLTPLAEGIELAYEYLRSSNMFNSEVVLISDGVPTISKYGDDPVSEAELAATKLLSDKINFLCVGVEPNKHIMKKIASAGGGKLFITKDLREDVLLQIFRREHERKNRS